MIAAADLEAEMAGYVANLSVADLALLRYYSLPEAILGRGAVGVADADPDASGGLLWAPEGHSKVYVAAARVGADGWPETTQPEIDVWRGPILDLVAFRPETPGRWWLRVGLADCLGCYGPQFLGPAPVRVIETPLDWLRAGGAGVCPLARDLAGRQSFLLGLGTVAARDLDHAMELRRLLERPISIPRIVIQ